ncbi:ADP-ribosyl cyclase/cyclic ADP-ribose hydrolase 1-like isoform X1 [Xyrichtys novacula]|uniref:ADP-ribosyl cyclase/cyclic ADP-ribose hydrolase n=1 Tax=Xyrichtys novacula TaxID=13765 RepID=A0AAV1HAD0_XYRNO|nr:ADP-ribosyl cyclase/cyclic ADP-ribose hydrolase 1-like isoform X1 [Xyrichtys novacula]
MASKKSLPISGTLTVMVIVVVLAPSALLDQTAEFKAAFMKKCTEYPKDKKTCEATLAIFERAYVGKKQTDVTEDSYNELFDNTPFTHPCEKTMLWSGTNYLAHKLSEKRDNFFNVADTLLGNVLNKLIWCGKAGSKETFTTDKDCPYTEPNPTGSFWFKISARFAQFACGNINLLLKGENLIPFDPRSVLATHEIPNLQTGKVEKVTVILVVDKKTGTKCKNDSLNNLSNILKGKKIGYDCKEVTQTHIEDCIDRGIKDCF